MGYWHISDWTKKLYPDVIWDKRGNGKKLMITFDDGPTPGVTDEVLNILDQFNAKATFFCVGRNVEHFPDLFHKIISKNHAVGNHTYSHLNGWKTKYKEYLQDTDLASQHIPSRLFRPPYGQIKRSQINYLKEKYKIIMWEVMSHDYEKLWSKELCLNAIFRYTKEGSIIVFHDSEKAWGKLQYLLSRVLEEFSGRGFGFEKIY